MTRLSQRFAFRFGVVYLGLFCLATQISASMIRLAASPKELAD